MVHSLSLDLRADSDVPLHRQIYQQIRQAILTGRVRSQQKLPASRQLAQSLGVSRSTVVQSYDQLISEGYIKPRRGAGTFVCAVIPDDLLAVSGDDTAKKGAFEATYKASNANRNAIPSLSAFAQRLNQVATPPQAAQTTVSFRYWRPDLSIFPVQQWQRLVTARSMSSTDWMTYGDEPMGYGPLRNAIAAYISQTRAVRCVPDQILITQGTQQAIGLIAQVLLTPGDTVALEEPGYLSAQKIFASYGASLQPIPVDQEGLSIDALASLSEHSARPPKLVYVTPSHQFPTGALMPLSRRLALLQWAQENNALIIEDDYDSEFRYSGRPIPALQGFDEANRVLYIGTFSKIMFPGLRLGYLVLPPELVSVFTRAKWLCDRQCSLINQAALTDFIQLGHLARHIRKMRTVYAQRRETLMQTLQTATNAFGSTEFFGDAAGLHLMAQLPPAKTNLSSQVLVARAQTQGVSLFSTRRYYLEPPTVDEGKFIFGFGGLSEKVIKETTARLRLLLKK